MNIDWQEFEELNPRDIVSRMNSSDISTNRKNVLEYSVQLDEIVRRDMIKRCHSLEVRFMKMVPKFKCMVVELHQACSIRFAHLEERNSSPLQGIDKLAIGFNGGEMIKKGKTKDGVKEQVLESIKKMQDLYKILEDDALDNELIVDSVLRHHSTIFDEICWHHNIRNLFYSKLSRSLETWTRLVRRLRHRLKRELNVSRVNEFEYKDFLENFDAYPLDDEVKKSILVDIEDYTKKIGQILEVDFLKRKDDILSIMSLYAEYIDVKNEILLSVMKYPAYLCTRQNAYRSDPDAVGAIVSRSVEKISEILYKYDNEHNFMNFVHSYCQNAISQSRLESKIVVNNMEMENKRRAIYQALNEVQDVEFSVDYVELAKRVMEIDPKAVFEPKALENFINGSLITSLDTGSYNSDKPLVDELEALTGGLFDSEGPGDNELMTEELVSTIMEAIELLPDVQQKIMSTYLWGDTEEQKITNIATKNGLSYDQTRGIIDKSKKRVVGHVKEAMGIE